MSANRIDNSPRIVTHNIDGTVSRDSWPVAFGKPTRAALKKIVDKRAAAHGKFASRVVLEWQDGTVIAEIVP